jgi:Ca2+-transporting ATPase
MRRKITGHRLLHGTEVLGLTLSEVEAQRNTYGNNSITERRQSEAIELMIDTLKDPMIWFLLLAALLFLMIGEQREALILILAIAPLTGMDAFLHWRTARSTQKLRKHMTSAVEVLREGQRIPMPASVLVPGDIVFLKANEPIPADGVMLETQEVQIDESSLTGESLPVIKQTLLALPATVDPVIDETFWGFAGTRLLAGSATMKVVYTGSETLYGEIIHSVESSGHEQTPLQLEISHLIGKLLLASLLFCILLAVTRVWQGKGIVDALLGAATLAVAAIPEEFPVVFTFLLGLGVYRMAQRKALVRRAVSVENIGRVTCICSDKTGTMTEGRLHLAHLKPAPACTEAELMEASALASRDDSNDPMDQAILEKAPAVKNQRNRIALFPFTELRRRETVAIEEQGTVQFYCKGSPETILSMCHLASEERRSFHELTKSLAAEGHKVIGAARLSLAATHWDGEEPVEGYAFLGLLAFEDPIRKEVPDAVRACQAAGIHVLMITGDHAETAACIAREIGLGSSEIRLINAEDSDLSQMDAAVFMNTDVVARALPTQKLDIVTTLKKKGERIAVTGDGINDVPALKAADVGIAMGERGSRSARDVSSIVLSDDNFATIVAAIAEGRQLLLNLRRSFQYLIAVHIPLVTTAALIPLLGFPLLYLPIHIVWLELIIHPTALFAFQDNSASELKQRPQDGSQGILSRRDWILVLGMGGLTTLAVFSIYFWAFSATDEGARARTLALMTLILSNHISAVWLSRLRTTIARLVIGSLFLAELLLLLTPMTRDLLHLTPLQGWQDWLLIAVCSLTATLLSLVLPAIIPESAPTQKIDD